MDFLANIYTHYHAHIYFDEQSENVASALRERISDELKMPVGRFHTRLVGPHTKWSFMVAFDQAQFDAFTIWLKRHHEGLSVLIHADTGNDYIDHTEHVCWLGNPIDIDLSKF
ncbi:DOPA 4,5-dioxygenase family protein [Vibrio marisflavi]|uniref:4,5-dioxygenase n=1 Tax=Vibrio marisflavi CECT 7928 TaxID=634439 RepID=A0ABM8ZYL3_9VIBR|nr:DOPA 4,5-dioxygenase family protein [Vibrio marisflavi]CAH0536033.1 hypothetical protein VMF7928_00129 [Vibrio marisflavi CECT 7928]